MSKKILYLGVFLLLCLPLRTKAQVELIVPLSEDIFPSCWNPAALGQHTGMGAGLLFRNQLEFRNNQRVYTGNMLMWEQAIGSRADNPSFWGLDAFSSNEKGLQKLRLEASYAHRIDLSSEFSLRLGLRMGMDRLSYADDYLFPDEIDGTNDRQAYPAKNSLNTGAGMSIDWRNWQVGMAVNQLGNRLQSVRGTLSILYGTSLPVSGTQLQLQGGTSLYYVDNQTTGRVKLYVSTDHFGLGLIQSVPFAKTEQLSGFSLSFKIKSIHFQYDTGWIYGSSKGIVSSGKRHEFSLIYLL